MNTAQVYDEPKMDKLASILNFYDTAAVTQVKQQKKTCLEKYQNMFKNNTSAAIKYFLTKVEKESKILPIEVKPNYKPKTYPQYGEEFAVEKQAVGNSEMLGYLKFINPETDETVLKDSPAHIYAMKRSPKNSSSRSGTNPTGGKAHRHRP